MRPIDADELANEFAEYRMILSDDDNSCKIDFDAVLYEITNAPTISPDSLRPKGWWEKVPPYTAIDGGWHKAVICSECKTHYVSDGNTPWRMHNFCAHCGADMREDKT